MKNKTRRIKTDAIILISVMFMTGLFFRFPFLYYLNNAASEWVLNFVGMVLILSGAWVRMTARGHKKLHSSDGQTLMRTGLYAVVRNPMYIGSYLFGAGFVLIIWPWWILPIFTVIFFMRFRVQVLKEEEYLRGILGREYDDYCHRVSRFSPDLARLIRTPLKELIGSRETCRTQERFGFLIWPTVAVGLEFLQHYFVFDKIPLGLSIASFSAAIFVFATVSFFFSMQSHYGENPKQI